MIIKIGKDPSVDKQINGVDYKLDTDDRFVSRHHAYIRVESSKPLRMSLTRVSPNRVFINGADCEEGKAYPLNINDVLQFVSIEREAISIQEVLTYAKVPLPKAEVIRQYRPDFVALEPVYEFYKTESAKLTKFETRVNNFRNVIFALSTASVGLIAFFDTSNDNTTMKLVKIGVPVLVVIIATIVLNSLSPRDKLIRVTDQFKVEYICPSCFRYFGDSPWILLKRQGQCQFCRASWLEEK